MAANGHATTPAPAGPPPNTGPSKVRKVQVQRGALRRLPGLSGERLHGHNYTCSVRVFGPLSERDGTPDFDGKRPPEGLPEQRRRFLPLPGRRPGDHAKKNVEIGYLQFFIFLDAGRLCDVAAETFNRRSQLL